MGLELAGVKGFVQACAHQYIYPQPLSIFVIIQHRITHLEKFIDARWRASDVGKASYYPMNIVFAVKNLSSSEMSH